MDFIKCDKELINVDEINSIYEQNVEDNEDPYCVVTTKNGLKYVLDGIKIDEVCNILYNHGIDIYNIK